MPFTFPKGSLNLSGLLNGGKPKPRAKRYFIHKKISMMPQNQKEAISKEWLLFILERYNLAMRFDILDRTTHRCNCLSIFVRNIGTKFIFKSHN
jgi:hypothetical protein